MSKELPVRSRVKLAVLRAARAGGLFTLARHRSRDSLRILCYHGIWPGENRHFDGSLFMSPETFERRMASLGRLGYPVLALGEALELQEQGRLPSGATVITIDDGWYSTYRYMLPVLERYGLPATIYCSTYFSCKRRPISRLVLRYLLMESTCRSLDVGALQLGLEGVRPLGSAAERNALAEAMDDRAFALKLEQSDRDRLCRNVAEALEVDLNWLVESRLLDLMTPEELLDTDRRGFDLQLHTHRHRIAVDSRSTLTQELADNRAALEPLVAHRVLEHFCYPSGVYDEGCFTLLQAARVRSATTCVRGLNTQATSRLELRRFLDSESMTDIDFEADLSGFSDLRHSISRLMSPSRQRLPATEPSAGLQ